MVDAQKRRSIDLKLDRIIEIEEWASELRKRLPLEDVVLAVKERMRRAPEESHLAAILKGALIELGRDAEASQLIDDMIARNPDDVRFPIEKASHCLYFLHDPIGALKYIDRAIVRANRTGFFRREALGVKARILLQLGQGQQLSTVLEEIMTLRMNPDIPDVGKERDFVDRAPAGLLSEDVVARYDSFCPKQA